jgi:hypothetical protein
MIAAARLPLRSDPANNPFDRPSAHGRIKFSTGLLDVNQVLQPLCEHRSRTHCGFCWCSISGAASARRGSRNRRGLGVAVRPLR